MTDSNRSRKEILFDGFTDDEILRLPAEQIEALVLNGEPVDFERCLVSSGGIRIASWSPTTTTWILTLTIE